MSNSTPNMVRTRTSGSRTAAWKRRAGLLGAALLMMGSSAWAQLTGTRLVPGDYSTLAEAITDLNTQGVGTGGVIISVVAGNAQTAPVGGYSITATGTSGNPIVIQGNGNTVTAFAGQSFGVLTDAIFKLIGSDWVTLEGFVMQENAANTTTAAASNNMTEWGVALLYATTGNGAQNCTIRNNTISLNRTYQNTWGIYSNSTHSATAPTTAATATGADGGNSGLVIQGNSISNVNNGICVVGPTAAADHNTTVTIGGALLAEGNTLTDFGTTGTFSSYANVSGTVNGILVRNVRAYTVRNNSITSSNGGTTVGSALRGVFIPSFSNAPTGTNTQVISNNSISVRAGLAGMQMAGIAVEGTTSNSTSSLTINNNDFNNITHTVAGSATVSFISNGMSALNVSISNNTFTNLSPNTTGNVTFIGNSLTMPATGTLAVNGNSIVTAFSKPAGGTVSFYSNGGSSTNGTTSSVSNNVISNITLAGATLFTGINENDWLSASSAPVKTVNGNTLNNLVLGSGTTTIFSVNGGAAGSTVNNNTVSNVTRAGAITAFTVGTNTGSVTAEGNTVNGLTATASGAVVGMSLGTTTTGTPTANFRQNVVRSLSTTFGSAVVGITIGGGSTLNVERNQVFNLEANNAAGSVSGITVSSGTTVTLNNNLVGDLRAPSANAANAVIGLNIGGGTTVVANFNTVRLAGTSTGAAFGSSALSASTTPNLTLRNNILVNATTPVGTGLAVAYRRSSTTLTSYNAASNNNLYWAGTPGANNLIYNDGTNSDQTLAAFRTRMATRDQASVTENPPFASTTSGDANFLRFAAATSTQAESGGVNVAGITADVDGELRFGAPGYAGAGTAVDIGADEFEGAPLDLVAPIITFTALGNACDGSARTLTATITDASGVPTSGIGLPVLYWRIGSVNPFTAVQGSFVSGNTYSFTFGAGAAPTDTVRYYIVAQDLAPTPNVSANPSAGAAGFSADPPAVATAPTTPASYRVLPPLSGTLNVGAGGAFTTLTAAATAYNSGCVSGAVVFQLTDATYTTPAETFPILFGPNPGASASNTLTIRPTGTTLIEGSAGASSAVIILDGADWVTIDGSNSPVANSVCPPVASSRNLTIRNTNTSASSAVVWMRTGTGTNSATNNTVRNCVIRGSGSAQTLYGLGSGSGTISTTSTGTANNNNAFVNNDIGAVQYGIYSGGLSTANFNTGTVISQNVMEAAAPNNVGVGGILAGFEDGIQITGNRMTGIDGSSDRFGISAGMGTALSNTSVGAVEVRNATITNNVIGTVTGTGTNSSFGIALGQATAGTSLIANNLIRGVSHNSTSPDLAAGIALGGGAGSTTRVYHNNVVMQGAITGATAANQASACVAVLDNADPVVDIRNNILQNTQVGNGSATTRFVSIGLRGNTYANLTSNNNVLFAAGAGPGTYGVGLVNGVSAAGTVVANLNDWFSTTAQDAASLGTAAGFVSTTDVRTDGNSALNIALNAAGATVTGAGTDVNCQTRSTPPDIGANEFTPATCFLPAGFAVSGVTFQSAVLNWTSNVGETYDVEVRTSGNPGDPGATFTATGVSGGPVNVTGLVNLTTYFAYIRTTCPGPENSVWSAAVSFSTPLAPVTVFPWNENFTANNGNFTFVNGTQANQWRYGSAAGNPANSLYISNDNGVTNTYNVDASSVVHVWRDLLLTTPGEYNLQFDYRAVGEDGFDYVRVWLAPTSYLPVAGTQTTAAAGRVQIGGNFHLTDPINYTTSPVFNIPASFVGTTARLIFEWRNDGDTGAQPSGSIDNINVGFNPCAPATNLTLTTLLPNSVGFSWTASPTASSYDFEVRTSGDPVNGPPEGVVTSGNTTSTTATATGLTQNTAYTFWIRSQCTSPAGTGSWLGGTITTPCDATALPFAEGFNAASTTPACWRQFGVTGTVAASFPTSSTGPTTSPQEGTRFMRWTSTTAGNETRVVSPAISTVGTASVDVRFHVFENNNTSFSSGAFLNEGVTLEYSLNGVTWIPLQFFPRHNGSLPAGTGAWSQKIVTNTTVGEQPVVFFAWRFRSENGNATSVDNVRIFRTPVCPSLTAAVNNPANCAGNTFTVDLDVASTGSVANLVVNPSVFGGAPIAPLNVGAGITQLGPFQRQDLVTVNVTGDANGPCVQDLGRFFSTCPIEVDCNASTPVVVRHCYAQNDPRTITFQSSEPGTTLDITFLAGSGIAAGDVIDLRDGDANGSVFYTSQNTTTDLSAEGTLTSLGEQVTLTIQTTTANSCAAGTTGLTGGWTFNVRCSGCIEPFIQDIVPDVDCAAGTFTLPVEFFYFGFNATTEADATSARIRYVVNGNAAGADTILVTALDTPEILGPFALGSTVDIKLLHEDEASCDRVVAPVTVGWYPACANDEACNAFPVPVNPNFTCAVTIPGQMGTASLSTGITSTCTTPAKDLWYRFVATQPSHRVVLGGTTTALSQAVFVGACDGTLTQVGSCVTTTGQNNLTGLTVGTTYYIRVTTTNAASTVNFTVCVSAPPVIDMQAITPLVTPTTAQCFSAAETVTVRIRNASVNTPIDFSVNPVTVTTQVTGAVTATLTATVNTGTLATNATLDVPMSTTLNMSTAGTYTFAASTSVAGDGNTTNDGFTGQTRTVVAPVTLAQFALNFDETPGFNGTNLQTITSSRWRETTNPLGTGTTSAWASSVAAENTQLGSGISAKINMTTTARNEWLVGPKVVPVVGSTLQYRIAITEGGTSAAADAEGGMQATGAVNDRIQVVFSDDCGANYFILAEISPSNTVGLTNVLQLRSNDLSAFAGQELILGFRAFKGSTTGHPNYDFHIDGIEVVNLPVCNGTPTAGTISTTTVMPACTPANFPLVVSGQSTNVGEIVGWAQGTSASGPFTPIDGLNVTNIVFNGVTEDIWLISTNTCLGNNQTVNSAPFLLDVKPTPAVTAVTNDGPVCAGTTVNLSATSNLPGVTFTWSGPGSYSATGETVSRVVETNQAGSYGVTATLDGCTSASSTTTVVVNPAPTISSVTGTPNPVCVGNDAQLQVNATFSSNAEAAGNYTFSTATGFALQDMTGATSLLGTGVDDSNSSLTNIGFTFRFGGVNYTQFSVSSNGQLRLGSTATSAAGNDFATVPTILPFWDDLHTGTDGGVEFLLTGTAPNQVLVVQWRVRNFTGDGDANFTKTFQAWLYEGSNEVRFVYGAGTAPAGNSGGSIGLATTGSFNSVTVSTHTASNSTANNANVIWPGAGRTYLFVPAPLPTLTYAWSPATFLNDPAIANPVAQAVQNSVSYSVTVGNSFNSCTRTGTLNLVSGEPLVASVSANDTTLCVGQSATLSAVVTGGGTPYFYSWSPGGAETSQITVSPTDTTVYTVTVTDNCAVQTTASLTVNVNPLPSVALNASTNLFCGTGSADLTASGASSYTWSPAAGLSATTGANVTATPTTTRTYTVTGTDANGCTNTASTTISVAPVVSVTLVPGEANLCLDGSTNLVATASPTGFTASASSATNLALAIPDNSLTGVSSSLSLSGGEGNVEASTNVSVSIDLTHTWNVDVDIYLVGPANCGTLELSTDNGAGFGSTGWANATLTTPSALPNITTNTSTSVTGSWAAERTATTAPVLNSGPLSGTYSLPATALAGCAVNGTWTLWVFDDAGGDTGTLNNWSLSVGSGVNAGTYTHVITGPGTIGTVVGSGANNSVGTASVSGLPQGENTFTVVSTSTTGCSATTTATITVGEPLVVNITAGDNPICAGETVTLTANAVGGGEPFDYVWSPGGATTASINVSPATTTLYSVTVSDDCGNQETATLNLVVNPTPTADASASLACVGGTLQLTGTTDIGTSFAWTGPAGFQSTAQNPSVSSLTTANSGPYTFVATLGDCSASDVVNVTVNAASSTVSVNPPSINSCEGNTVVLTASGGTGAVPATATLSGTSPTTGTLNTPFNRADENRRTQYLIRASDLTAAGITAGNLTSVSFNVTSGIVSPNFQNGYTVKISNTTATTTTSSAPLTLTAPVTVFGPVDYSPVLGANTLVFDTPFNWNGTSNIVVDICYENDAPGGTCASCWGNSPTMSMVTAAYTGTWNSSADNAPRCEFTGSGSTSSSRPVMVWGYTAQLQPTYTWSPATNLSATTGASVTASVSSTITYTVTATLPSGCSNTTTSTINVGTNSQDVTLELRSNNGAQVSWEIVTGTNVVVCSGGGYPAAATLITETCCLAEGCYVLRVFDSAGDGFGTNGGYQLRLSGAAQPFQQAAENDRRIIDNFGNFLNGSVSSISGGPNAFCFPMSSLKPVYTSREKLDWVAGQYIVAEADAAVSAQWQVGDQTDDGYEFWFFDPNGGYSFRRFRNHATSDGFANVGATRACHARINGWLASNHIPANRLMNVRIRTRVNGVNGNWGPTFRFMIDPVRAACPLTKLMDIPGNQFLSCNQTRNWGPNNYVHARPVSGANRYQFRFRTGDGFNRVITSNNYFIQLNWATQPLVAGQTYDVDVRISRDGGTTWCISGNSWGDICKLTITGGNAQDDSQNLAIEPRNGNLMMYPNPNRGDQLWLTIDQLEEGVLTVAVDIMDLTGKRVVGRILPTQGDHLNAVLDVNGDLAAGVYIVNITAGDRVFTERLVIAR